MSEPLLPPVTDQRRKVRIGRRDRATRSLATPQKPTAHRERATFSGTQAGAGAFTCGERSLVQPSQDSATPTSKAHRFKWTDGRLAAFAQSPPGTGHVFGHASGRGHVHVRRTDPCPVEPDSATQPRFRWTEGRLAAVPPRGTASQSWPCPAGAVQGRRRRRAERAARSEHALDRAKGYGIPAMTVEVRLPPPRITAGRIASGGAAAPPAQTTTRCRARVRRSTRRAAPRRRTSPPA